MRRWMIVRSFALALAAIFVATQAVPPALAQDRDRDRDNESRRSDQDRDEESRRSDRDDQSRRSAKAALVLPVVGTSTGGGTFSGTLSVQRFARRNSTGVVAVGMVAGTVVDATGAPVGTFLRGPVEIPVTVSQGSAGLAPSGGTIRPAGGQQPAAPRGFMLVQAQQTCGVLHLEFGAINLNVLGLVVMTNPIVLDISGDTGGVLGNLVCSILNAVGNIVNLLNTLLGVLGGLTGGLLGGLSI